MTKSLLMLLCLSGISCGKSVKVTVVGEDGSAVEGATVVVWSIGSNKSKDQKFEGRTSNKGFATVEARDDARRLHIYIEKKGYYKNSYRHKDGTAISAKNKSIINVKAVLRKKIKPLPLFVREYRVYPPVNRQKLGFDFEVGDFVAPHGKGKTTDVFFKVISEHQDSFHYNYELNITFPHEKDGIQHFVFSRDDIVSELKSSHLAPETGYKIQFQRKSSSKGRKSKTNAVRFRNHWMRVRTKTDEKGNIISANYVKIYGDFPDIVYYFNPTPNDRNLEFDPSGNLSKNLENKHRKFAP